MKKKSTTFTDLSNKQLLHLKELYIQKKVDSMNHEELKAFVFEIISHQINDTIGKEEEMEAWNEMSSFFGVGNRACLEDIRCMCIKLCHGTRTSCSRTCGKT